MGPESAKAVYARTRDRSPISSSARKRGRGPWWRTLRRSAAAMVWRPPCWHCGPNCDCPGAGADHRSSQHTSSQERRRFAAGRRSAFLGCSRTTASGRWPAPSPLDPECRASFASRLRPRRANEAISPDGRAIRSSQSEGDSPVLITTHLPCFAEATQGILRVPLCIPKSV